MGFDAAPALAKLDTLAVKGRAPKTGYTREQLGPFVGAGPPEPGNDPGRVVRRTGFVLPLVSGLILGAITATGLLTQRASTSFGMVWFWFALFGAGVGLVAAPSTAAAMVSVDPSRTGMASGAVTARQLGSVLGTSTLGAVLTTTYRSRCEAVRR